MNSQKTADLLKVLGQKALTMDGSTRETHAPPSRAVRQSKKSRVVAHRAHGSKAQIRQEPGKEAAPIRGRGVHLWLHPKDESNIRVISSWLGSQRGRINDSLAIKCALRVARLDSHLLAAYDEAVKVDGRRREKKLPRPSKTG